MTTTTHPELTLAHLAASVPAISGGNTAWASRYARELREIVIRQASRQPRNVQRNLGPSELGHICHRLVVSKFAGQPVTNHVVDPWPSIVGTAVHAWLAEKFLIENTINGVLRWVTEQRVHPDPAYPGTADLYDAYEQALVDHKVLGPTTLAKVQSAQGPPWHYLVQLLLYAHGYRKLGLPVRRVVLAAWPRTSSYLDDMYCWERPYVPDRDDRIVENTLRITAVRRQVAQEVLAGRLLIDQVPRTPGDECYFCLSGETEIVTRDGIKPIRDLAGSTHELLVPATRTPGPEARGSFMSVPVRDFGQQRLWKITLGSQRAEHVIHATAEHRWLLTKRLSRADPGNKYGRAIRQVPDDDRFERTTAQLQPGDRLRSLRAWPMRDTQMMPWAVAQGFVFGDGSCGQGDQPASLSICDNGKDEAMLPFFPFSKPAQYKNYQHIPGLPRCWKALPPIRESRAFLISWLAGYFAADGDVTKAGQVTLSSASREAILFARDVAAVCGIGYSPPRSKIRLGLGTEPAELWMLNLRRRDLPSWFFLIKEHAIRAAAADEDETRGTYWTVKSVEVTDRFETVYCATVPDIEIFGLVNGISTLNCPFYRPQSARDGGPGCPGQSAMN